MADNYREEAISKKRGRSASKLSVRLFLLDPNKDITKVTKEIGSEKGLNELKQKGYGPPSKEHCVADDRVEFSLQLTNEEFKQKLVEIYPSLENACFMFMKAGKDNTLKELNPGVCCYKCYTPENVYFSERGQGKLYIRMISENEISPCNHGVSLWKRLRSTVGGNQQVYIPIAPKPVAAVVPAPSTTLPTTSTSTVISVAAPTNYQLSASRNHETESRTALSNLPALDLSSSQIGVPQATSTPASQNSGNMVIQTPLLSRAAGTILPFLGVNRLEKSTVQGSSSISEAATRPELRSLDNTIAQNQLPISSIVNQSASTPTIYDSVGTNSLPQPSQPVNSSVDMLPSLQLPASATVSQMASTTPVDGSFDILSQRELPTLATNSLSPPSQLFNSSINMVPQGQSPTSSSVSYILPVNRSFNIVPQEPITFDNSVNMVPEKEVATSPTVSQLVSRSVQPFVSGNTPPENTQISGSAGVSDQGVTQSLLNASAVLAHASSRIARSPGLNLLADVGEVQREQYEHSIANRANIQENLEFETFQELLRNVQFFQNVESTGKLEISLDVLNNDVLLKKLNESKISIHTVEIQSTCEVHQVLKKFSLPSFLRVLHIRENRLSFEDNVDLLRCLRSVDNLHQLDLCRTKFNESTFFIFISALNYCKDLTSLILTDNSLIEQEINGLITVLEKVKNLKTLTLSKCLLTETQANAILHKHEQVKNIVTLDLSQNAIQGNEIVVGICQLQSLEELDLSHNCVKFSPLPNLEGKCNYLSTCLKVISLSSNHMKPDDISWFCSLIRSDVVELNLDFNHVGHSIRSLISLGGRIKHLKVLGLANTGIFDNVDRLAFLLSLVRELEDLNLSSNNLMADDFQQLQTPLSKLTQLKTLNLSMNAIGPDGMKALADIFQKLPLLERLDMSSSYFREKEVSVLCKSLVSLKKLKYLNLSGNIIDAEVLDDALVLPATLEELLFSHIIHGEKLFNEMRKLLNLRKLHLEPNLRRCDVDALINMLFCFPKLEELSLADTSLEELVLTDMSGTQATYEKLFCAMKKLKHLRKVSLGGVIVYNGLNVFTGMFSSRPILEGIVFPDLSLKDADSITTCLKDLQSFGYLRSLDLLGIKIDKSTTRALACVLPSLQFLEKLRLKFDLCSEDNESERKLLAAFGKLKNLKELFICDTELQSINALSEVLPSLPLLEKVDLYISVPDAGSKLLFGALEKLRYLKEFPCCAGISDADVEAFVHALSSLPLLEKLDVSTCLSNTEYVGQLYVAIGKLKYLRTLDLYFGVTTINAEVEALAKVLPSLELLEKLILLWEKELDREHKKTLLAAISKLRYLKELHFNSDIGAERYIYFEGFGKMLKSLRLLETLELMKLKFKNESEKKELLVAVGKLKYLKKLELRWEKITQTNADDLVKTLASLQVLEEFTLWVRFYCSHASDDDCDNECYHNCEDECDDECNHNCYDDSCNKCRHDEYESLKDSVKTKVLSAVRRLKYFKKSILDQDDIIKQARKAST